MKKLVVILASALLLTGCTGKVNAYVDNVTYVNSGFTLVNPDYVYSNKPFDTISFFSDGKCYITYSSSGGKITNVVTFTFKDDSVYLPYSTRDIYKCEFSMKNGFKTIEIKEQYWTATYTELSGMIKK